MKVCCEAFLYLQFGYVIFLAQSCSKKVTIKAMLNYFSIGCFSFMCSQFEFLIFFRERIFNIDYRCQFHQRSMNRFCVRRHQKCKKDLTVFFALSVSVCAKAAHRTLMKLSQGVNCTSILQAV